MGGNVFVEGDPRRERQEQGTFWRSTTTKLLSRYRDQHIVGLAHSIGQEGMDGKSHVK
jgi:hypothetical protein